jgi:multidrug efflux pump subunit AcrB
MWIVRLALQRPYTFVVAALLIVVLGVTAISSMRTDIFPEIDIPVVTVIWTYKGMETSEAERRITTYSEYAITSNVNEIKRVESQTLNGVAVIKIYFHQGVNIGTALSQVTAVTQAIRALMPPGIQPPIVLRFNASSVPILQVSLSSSSMSEEEVYDYGLYILRTQLSTVQGLTMSTPYGGRERQIMVDLDPRLLQAKGISPKEVADAIDAYNLAYPTGVARIGAQEYPVTVNNTPLTPESFNEIPIKVIGGATVFMRDVAQVRDGSTTQTTVVRRDGSRGVLITLLKNGNASTLDIVNQIKEMMPQIRAAAPAGLRIDLLFDQSVFVVAAIEGVVVESIIAGLLTAAMILVFLGSWRSTLIVTVSIPLAILSSIAMLYLLGHSLNVMTLGGLALAVGILVDDATVEIENIHRNIGLGKPLRQAILDGASQIAGPTFVSTLTISIVFVSVLFLEGAPKYLFTPLALAVAFAMLASYLLSRTIVPTMVDYLIPAELEHDHSGPGGWFGRFHQRFQRAFERFRDLFAGLLHWNLTHRRSVFFAFGVLVVSGLLIMPWIGRDFFPTVDAGQFRLHVRVPAGTRIEQTEHYFSEVERAVRQILPEREVELVIDNIGLPNRTYAMAFGDSATTGMADGEILVSLTHHRSHSTPEYVARLRRELPKEFPQLTFFFQPADIVSQILNFGLPAPIDIQIAGLNQKANSEMAAEIVTEIRHLRGVQDVHMHQVLNVPKLHVAVDQTRARELGLTQQDVANSLLVSLSGSGQVQPNYWVDPKMGISYLVETKTPTYKLTNIDSVNGLPLRSLNSPDVQLLANVAKVERGITQEVTNHTNVQPTLDVYANVEDRDLGSVAADINRLLVPYRARLEPGNTISVRGQVESMESAFWRLGLGLIFAAVLVYLLMVVNFQSWLDPFIILTALPGTFVGIVWSLFLWRTTFSVPALMGAIMSIGVATANSILLVTFANEQRGLGKSPAEAALEAGRTRMRPVLMTAAAMIIGMLPMSLGLGEGGEQNAPLGRAVIGGLLVATLTTLLIVPVIYSLLRTAPVPVQSAERESPRSV